MSGYNYSHLESKIKGNPIEPGTCCLCGFSYKEFRILQEKVKELEQKVEIYDKMPKIVKEFYGKISKSRKLFGLSF